MSKSRLFMGLLLVALLALFAPVSHAQTTNCQSAGSTINCNVIAVGSSAIFPSAAIAAVSGDPTRGNGPLCGSSFWTGSANGVDARSSLIGGNGIPKEPGTVWISWDNDTNPTVICAYLSVDSIVGQRLFYGQGPGASGPANNGTLLLNTSACTTAGANKVAFIWDTATTGLPSAVYNALEGTTGTTCPTAAKPVNFTTASTDVDPPDALFVGNQRVLASDGNASPAFPADAKGNLGYGGANCNTLGAAVASSYETSSTAQSVCYTYVAGQPDPISGTLIPSSTIVSEGALAMLPIINVTNAASGGFGDLFNNRGFNDVLSHDIAAGYAFSPYGTATLTRDLYLGSNASSIPVTVVHYLSREPQSGTYTTWEWQVLRNKESALGGGGLSAETNICGPTQLAFGCAYTTPAANPVNCPTQANNLAHAIFPATASCSNYMSWGVSGFNALKTRVLGTGEMVSVSNINCATFVQPPGSTDTCNIEDTFGYAFYSLGTFGGKSNVRYLQLDSNDALYAGWSTTDGGNNGAFPVTTSTQGKSATPGSAPAGGCSGYFNGNGGTVTSFTCNGYPFPTFANIRSGNYRAWSINRVVWYATFPNGTSIGNPSWAAVDPPAFWLSAADQAAPAPTAKIPDFLPFAYCANLAACPENAVPTLTYPLNAFRSHYSIPTWGIGAANNGITGAGWGGVEVGGDVAGSIISVQAEADTVNFFSGSFLSWVQ